MINRAILSMRIAAAASATAVGATALVGCDDPTNPAAQDATEARGEPNASYTTRGLVIALPSPARGSSPMELTILHEPVPAFTNAEGAIVGMGEMEMPFPLAPGVQAADLAAGDKVEFDWSVWWSSPGRGWEIQAIRKLPADTELKVRTPRSQAGEK